MKLSSFKLDLPDQYIAKYPLKKREDSKLMVVHKHTGKIAHLQFRDIVNFFKEDDSLVLNDSKVFPAQLYGHKEKTEALIETLLLRELDPKIHLWDTVINPARKIRVGNKLYFGNYDLAAEVVDNTNSGGRIIRFFFEEDSNSLHSVFDELGQLPLPPMLERKTEALDKDRYQTVYAAKLGSTLALDGGSHFTPYILKLLELQDVHLPTITLHSSIHTLNPLLIQDLSKHMLNLEYFEIKQHAADIVNLTLAKKKKVCAVGVTTLKALESSMSSEKSIQAKTDWTNKFIYPPYQSHIANALLTNFHLPGTIPFINSLAFGGEKLMIEAYRTAIDKNYRFFVYGDALLILP